MDKWTMRSAHLKVRLIRVLSKENKEGEEEASTLKLITDAVVSTLGQLLTEVRGAPMGQEWVVAPLPFFNFSQWYLDCSRFDLLLSDYLLSSKIMNKLEIAVKNTLSRLQKAAVRTQLCGCSQHSSTSCMTKLKTTSCNGWVSCCIQVIQFEK